MPRLNPREPVFRRRIRKGSALVGNTPSGTLPPSSPYSTLRGIQVVRAEDLDDEHYFLAAIDDGKIHFLLITPETLVLEYEGYIEDEGLDGTDQVMLSQSDEFGAGYLTFYSPDAEEFYVVEVDGGDVTASTLAETHSVSGVDDYVELEYPDVAVADATAGLVKVIDLTDGSTVDTYSTANLAGVDSINMVGQTNDLIYAASSTTEVLSVLQLTGSVLSLEHTVAVGFPPSRLLLAYGYEMLAIGDDSGTPKMALLGNHYLSLTVEWTVTLDFTPTAMSKVRLYGYLLLDDSEYYGQRSGWEDPDDSPSDPVISGSNALDDTPHIYAPMRGEIPDSTVGRVFVLVPATNTIVPYDVDDITDLLS